jgi:hypothetical protein
MSFTTGNLLLVDYSARLLREGKAAISRVLARIFERLGTSAESWQMRLEKLIGGRLLGRFFASSRERLPNTSACTISRTWAAAQPDKEPRADLAGGLAGP